MNEEQSEFVSTVNMVVDNAVLEYLDYVEECEVEAVIIDGDDLFINAAVIADMSARATQMISTLGNEHATGGAALMSDFIMSLTQTLISRNVDFGVEGAFHNE